MMTTEMVLEKVWPVGEYVCAYRRVAKCSGSWVMLDFIYFLGTAKF